MPRNVLADGCEAVLGAVYLDGGLEAARQIIMTLWQDVFAAQTEAPIDNKSALQEWLMQRSKPLPKYEIIDRSGPDHAPEMIYEVTVGDAGSESATGGNRKIAEQKAAAALLARLQAGDRK